MDRWLQCSAIKWVILKLRRNSKHTMPRKSLPCVYYCWQLRYVLCLLTADIQKAALASATCKADRALGKRQPAALNKRPCLSLGDAIKLTNVQSKPNSLCYLVFEIHKYVKWKASNRPFYPGNSVHIIFLSLVQKLPRELSAHPSSI